MKMPGHRKTVAGIILLVLFVSSIFIFAHSLGITGTTKKNGFGCTCHNPNPSPSVTVTITGPDTLSVNQKAEYAVTIKGGPLVRAGTNIAVSAGSLSPVSSDLRLDASDGELTHTLPKAPSNNEVTFQFYYTAPSTTQNIIIYADGNSVNFNGINDTGDLWNFAPNKTVNIIEATGTLSGRPNVYAYKLNQNYPNPFNPTTEISYFIPVAGTVSLSVYNLTGEKITTLINEYQAAGFHSVQLDGSVLASGVYLYRINAGNFTDTKKLVLLK